ncbi:MAG: PTS sugar transporter subunit IIA [Candidatus Cloacimonetes bacterium]|nr:PTS sugar transporter subunit IIA [Candidatus Cloacimonadota bacterium]MCK9331820.1 PTS sugar transporter subunit IIA [Candidatus Cloacimonadota bacterium]MDD2210302.1 PTS sugar transporter subunit IIA [Candidatus Cloacimonadota bacterium]MDD3282140.1 PTS sugar transporter subunit IIA [Candidatus Cloacimonadota bacterium]MDD4231204.1 PTS sugar transporter subunit IIA [Candidatus Cloacimonadota bacterium]
MTDNLEVCSYLTPERVLCLDSSSKQDILSKMADLIGQDPSVKDATTMKKAIFMREKTMSTGIGEGVAIPHARTTAVEDFVIAFAKINEGIEFDAVDGKPVYLIFMIVANNNQDKKYVKLLSRLMLRMRKHQLVEKLMQATNPKEIYEILVESK